MPSDNNTICSCIINMLELFLSFTHETHIKFVPIMGLSGSIAEHPMIFINLTPIILIY